MKDDKIKHIYQLIAENELEKALDLLDESIPEKSSMKNEVIMLKSRFRSHKKDEVMGTISFDQSRRQSNQIRASLLYLIEDLERSQEAAQKSPGKTADDERELSVDQSTPGNFYFLSIELARIWSIQEHQVLDLSDGAGNPARWTIILGDNGTGKTTLLKCLIEMANFFQSNPEKILVSPTGEDEILPNTIWLDEENKNMAMISCPSFFAGLTGDKAQKGIFQGLELKLDPGHFGRGRLFKKEYLPEQHIFAFGASRKMGVGSLSETKHPNPTASLFDPAIPLINAAAWMLETDFALKSTDGEEHKRLKFRFERIKFLLARLLPEADDFRVSVKKGSSEAIMEAKTPFGWVEMKNLSLGYQTLTAWMVELAVRMFDRYPDSEDPLAEPAIVLVDEIDLHLHPKWQRTLIEEFTILFKRTQFIVTAHSPLIVQAAEDANLVLLKREGGTVRIYNRQDEEVIRGWRIDQVLTSDLFGLESSRPPKYDKLLKRQQYLATKPKLTKADKEELEDLGEELNTLEPVPETPSNADLWEALKKANDILQSGKQE